MLAVQNPALKHRAASPRPCRGAGSDTALRWFSNPGHQHRGGRLPFAPWSAAGMEADHDERYLWD
jgi:hypothetical protein